MIFKYPLGLLGLIGIPILILIYIIKSQYTEQTIASTYLWRLSEKFLKNKRPISKLSGIISLILQILAVTAASLIIAHPVFTIPNSALDYCFILDSSGSMNMESNGKTRLDLGKERIAEIINDSKDGSTYTIISAKAKPEVLFEKLNDKNKTIELLDGIVKSDLEGSCIDSLGYAQYYFNENKSLRTYLVTDKDYESESIEIINVSNNEANYALMDTSLDLKQVSGASVLSINGKCISFTEDSKLDLDLYVNDELVNSASINVKKNEAKPFEFILNDTGYSKIRVFIKNQDGMMSDNEMIFYNVKEEHNYSSLIISEHPAYLKNILAPNDNLTVECVTPEEYEAMGGKSGYSLYIYDSYNPGVLPKDGAVWLFNIDSNLEGSGFTVQDSFKDDDNEPILLELNTKSSHSLVKRLTKGLIGTDVYVKKYNKYGLIRNFTTLYSHDGQPMIFIGTNDYGNREVVFGFDLHDSNFPLQLDYITLSKNLIDYSFPIILDKGNFMCGDKLEMNVLSGCDSIRVESPSGRHSYLDASGIIAEHTLNEVGSYKIKMMFGKEEKNFNIFVSLPDKEKYDTEIEAMNLVGEQENNFMDGIYAKLTALFIVLAIVYMADWMVYCYEQYQLR